MAETRCDSRRQIYEIKNEVYGTFDKAEETIRASHIQAEEIVAKEKVKGDEMRQLSSKNMAGEMSDERKVCRGKTSHQS